MKKGSETLSGAEIAAIRIFSAGIVFLPFAVFYLKDIPIKKLPIVILTGVLGNLIPAFLFAISIKAEGDSALAGILNSLTPLFVIVIGALFFKVTAPKRKIYGVLVGFAGLVILSLARGSVSLEGLEYTLLILLATVCYGINVNIVSSFLKSLNPIKMATVSLAFMIIPVIGIMLKQQIFHRVIVNPEVRMSVLAASVLGIGGSAIATALFYFLIKKAGGLFASLVTYAIPVVAILWGMMVHEEIGWIEVGCLGIILLGVYLANRKPTEKQTENSL